MLNASDVITERNRELVKQLVGFLDEKGVEPAADQLFDLPLEFDRALELKRGRP
jgi:hypothetical protein